MKGLVLCGGQSSRMGTDKGFLMNGSTTWVQLAVMRLSTLRIPVILSVNHHNHHLFAATHENSLIVTDDSTLDIGGPLKGVLSAHIAFPHEDLFVLACDMPDMQEEVLHLLSAAYLADNHDAYVYLNESGPEPLCGIYRSGVLAGVLASYRRGELQRHSMQAILSTINTCYLPVPEAYRSAFRNYNSPNDLGNL